jgi:D-arginine dehydrogenase
VYDPDASDLDAALLLQGFIRGARARGATFALSSRITRISRGHFGWDLATDSDVHRAAYLVNAAGAWADAIAQMAGVGPIGLEPRRRTAFLFDPPVGAEITRWPAAIALDESWYFKPEARMLMGSPADAEIVSPHDVVAEDFDVAVAVDRIEAATTMSIGRPRHMWAGLRSFVADGEPVCGSDPSDPAFFWAAALGGYGIQSAPAVGALLASQLLDEAVPSMLGAEGFDVTLVSRARVGITGAPPDAGSAP